MLKPNDLNVGDIFYECSYGLNMEFKVTTKPTCQIVDNRKTWSWTATRRDETVVNYLLTEGLECYGPKLYSEPNYATIIDGKAEYKII